MGMFNWESIFFARLAFWCIGRAGMILILCWAGGGGGAKYGVLGNILAVRVDSISLRRCSKSAVYFHSAFRSFFCWLKSMAFVFNVTYQVKVIPVFSVILEWWVHLLEQDLTPSKLQSFPFISFASDALASLSNSTVVLDPSILSSLWLDRLLPNTSLSWSNHWF